MNEDMMNQRKALYSLCSSRSTLIDHAPPLVSLIKRCTSLRTLKPLHAAILRNQPGNLVLSTALASRYALLGSPRHALSFLSSASSPPDAFLWTAIIRGLADGGSHDRAIALYRRMRDPNSGVIPDNFTFPPVLKSCAQHRDLRAGTMVQRDAAELGYQSDLFVANSLINFYGKCGVVDEARKLFDEMRDRSVVTWSAMLGAYAQNGSLEEGMAIFRKMISEGISPNRSTFLNVMPCVSRPREADDLFRLMVEQGLDSDTTAQNAAITMYLRCGRIGDARRVFDAILEKDVVSWSSMIEAYAQADMFSEALDLFRQMALLRIPPDHVTFLGIIRSCSNSTLISLRQARFIHGLAVRSLGGRNLVVETALIDLYVKRGSLDSARRLFDRMQDKNLISWSTMISGYGMHGRGEEALELFHSMKGLMRPDHIVFVSILSACSHAGLISEGWQCFNSMESEFGIVPRSEHYACMVDLLGRSGKLEEARGFIERMPVRPDSSVWGSLLGACRIHPCAQTAELAARSLFELDPKNSGRYILLSNIYGSLGRVEEANRIRSLMTKRGLKKTAGYTVIEVKNKVYKFIAGEKAHPQSDLIYKELHLLMDLIKREGYVPNTNFALHDVDDESKESSLYVHSEKLAIVFGLMNSGAGCAIRIHKNLRVCGDCHTATKFISKVTNREISVRDSHRFHHFSDGVCSCGDYW